MVLVNLIYTHTSYRFSSTVSPFRPKPPLPYLVSQLAQLLAVSPPASLTMISSLYVHYIICVILLLNPLTPKGGTLITLMVQANHPSLSSFS